MKPSAYLAVAVAALALSGASAAQAATTISSTFDQGSEGWRYGTWNSGNPGREVIYNAAAGTITNPISQLGGGFLAPGQYLGDKSSFIGGEISFDLSSRRVSNGFEDRPLLILRGANGKSIFADWGPTPTAELTNFTVSLTASNFYVGNINVVSGPVSADLFADIMTDLEVVSILADWEGGVDFVRLDNVVMSSGAIPEPATWALMIGGFGLAGASLRARRRLQAA